MRRIYLPVFSGLGKLKCYTKGVASNHDRGQLRSLGVERQFYGCSGILSPNVFFGFDQYASKAYIDRRYFDPATKSRQTPENGCESRNRATQDERGIQYDVPIRRVRRLLENRISGR